MALGKNINSEVRRCCLNISNIDALDEGLELANCTTAIERKRISISNYMDVFPLSSPFVTQSKKNQTGIRSSLASSLETLPQHLLDRILRAVDHDDLKQLFHVSKVIREATLIAKQQHFAFSTPTKTVVFITFSDLEDREVSNAPQRNRSYRSRINRVMLTDITAVLFGSPVEDRRLNTRLVMEQI